MTARRGGHGMGWRKGECRKRMRAKLAKPWYDAALCAYKMPSAVPCYPNILGASTLDQLLELPMLESAAKNEEKMWCAGAMHLRNATNTYLHGLKLPMVWVVGSPPTKTAQFPRFNREIGFPLKTHSARQYKIRGGCGHM